MSEVKESLYSLVQQANAISQSLAESGGELTPELEALMTHVDVKLPEKIDGYAVVLDRLDFEANFYKSKADLYAKIARSHSNLRDRLKQALKDGMTILGVTEIRGNDSKFMLKNTAPSLVIDEANLDPAYLMTVTDTVPDKERIRNDLKQGATISGAFLRPGQSITPSVNKGGK